MINDWIDSFSMWFESWWIPFMDWFLEFPLIVQVFMIIGTIAVVILSVILVYYIIKGIAYLIYYLFKGIYLLLKAIFTGIYRLFKELYYAISGKPKPLKQDESVQEDPVYVQQRYEAPAAQQQVVFTQKPENYQDVKEDVAYCSECGNKFTERMRQQIHNVGQTYCVYCGKGFRLNEGINKVEIES